MFACDRYCCRLIERCHEYFEIAPVCKSSEGINSIVVPFEANKEVRSSIRGMGITADVAIGAIALRAGGMGRYG